tara:strand:- start:7869 stop:8384 length:516 start_codon:yes stop_codon:yes gene_type:complete
MNSLEASSIDMAIELLDNAVLAWGLIACGLAQLSKLLFEFIQSRKFRLSILFETGGMPSSHSALITGTASGVGLQLGFNDPLFALAATLAFIIMYDASGVRRAAGLTSAKVNELIDQSNISSSDKPLKETLGHTRLEVLVGSLFGPSIALPGILFIGSPLDVLHLVGLSPG